MPGDRSVQERLIFLVSPPRAGSTLLMRILHATREVQGGPEPHVIPPLAHLGYGERVAAAPFDPVQAQAGIRSFVARLPRGEADYYDACRAYADTLYGRMLAGAPPGKRYLLDKTPANALCLDFLVRLYPRARYLVLTRHPAAVFASYANSFFAGDYAAAARFNPILSRYVPAIGRFLRERPCPLLGVTYEDLVGQPEATLRRICAFLGVDFQPEALRYRRAAVAAGPGDPTGVERWARPAPERARAWAADLADPGKRAVVERQLAEVLPEDLAAWGYPAPALWAPAGAAEPEKRPWSRYALERRVLLALRRRLPGTRGEALVRKLHLGCEVLLRR